MANSLDTYLTDIRDKVLANQNLCKYLYYDDRDPLSKDDIADTQKTLIDDKKNQKIFLTPFSIDTTNTTKTTLTITIDNYSLDSKSSFYENMVIYFVVACNTRIWELKDNDNKVKLRVNGIWEELDKTFKHQSTIGVGKNHLKSGNIQRFNDFFWGYVWCLTAKDLPFYGVR